MKWTKKRHAELDRKNKVRGKTISLIKSGKIKRLPCSKCSNPNSEAHHKNYDDPYAVSFLCRGCHKRYHASLRRGMNVDNILKCPNCQSLHILYNKGSRKAKKGYWCRVCGAEWKKKGDNKS